MPSNKERYIELLKQPEQLSNCSVEFLESLIKKYPFHQPLRVLLIQKLMTEKVDEENTLRNEANLNLPFVDYVYQKISSSVCLPKLPPINGVYLDSEYDDVAVFDNTVETEVIEVKDIDNDIEQLSVDLIEKVDDDFKLDDKEEDELFDEDRDIEVEFEEGFIDESPNVNGGNIVDELAEFTYTKNSEKYLEADTIAALGDGLLSADNKVDITKIRTTDGARSLKLATFDALLAKGTSHAIEAVSEEDKESAEIVKQVELELINMLAVEKDIIDNEVEEPIDDEIILDLETELAELKEDLNRKVSKTEQAIDDYNSLMDSVKDKLSSRPINSDLTEKESKSIEKRISKSASFEDEFATETMARFLEHRGEKKQAIKVLKALKLKFPEKSAYFASEIERLNSKT